MHGVDHTFALQLDPDSIGLGTRKHDVKFELWSTIGPVRVLVHHVDQIAARDEHVSPRAKVLLDGSAIVQREAQLRAIADNRDA
jgi:hypothetical protein